jgi:hypothetical protein
MVLPNVEDAGNSSDRRDQSQQAKTSAAEAATNRLKQQIHKIIQFKGVTFCVGAGTFMLEADECISGWSAMQRG